VRWTIRNVVDDDDNNNNRDGDDDDDHVERTFAPAVDDAEDLLTFFRLILFKFSFQQQHR